MSIDPDQYQGNVVDTTRRIRATGPGTPSDDVVDAFSDGLVHVLRRVEIYESDGVTLWNPDVEGDEEFSRIIDGGVTIDANADERRVLDLTLDNRDLMLSPDPFDGLWYDKIIKPFYGVSFVGGAVPPKVAIIDSTSEATAKQLRQVLSTIGYNEIDILLDATTVDELRGYSVVFIYRTTAVSSKLELATQLWNQGVHVFTFGVGTDETNLPHYFSTSPTTDKTRWRPLITVPGLTPAWSTEWDGPGDSNYRRSMVTDAGAERYMATTSSIVDELEAPRTEYMQQFVATADLATGVLTGTFRSVFAADVFTFSSTTPPRHLRVIARVMNAAGTVERGVVFDGVTADVTSGTDVIRVCGGAITGNVNVQAGDILVVEVGAHIGAYSDNDDQTVRVIGYNQSTSIPDMPYADGNYPGNQSAWIELEKDVSAQWGLSPTEGDSPVAGSFTSTTAGVGAGRIPTATEIGVLPLAVYDVGDVTDAVTASLATSPNQGQWVDMHIIGFGATQTKNLLRAISHWIRGVGISIEWETQIGEFMIDGLSYPHFPDQLKITGRDYVKKMKGSKLARASTFTAGTKLRDLIIALATNSGISANRMRIGISDSDVLTSDMTYDVGTERWQIAKEACTSFNYEIFFDAFGWLTVRKFIDPYLGPTAWTFKTGADGGNLVSFDKTLNDSEIYNHIIVTATPAEGEEVMPYFGEAKNEDPSSPTRIERLGQRVLTVEANYLNSDAECKALAEALLKIHALEQYALNTQSIVFPWLEVGEIDEILDPEATPTEPTRYLMDNLNIPMTLSPMGGTGKRITIVGQTGNPIDTGDEGEE